MNSQLVDDAAVLYAQCLEKAGELGLTDPAAIAQAANAMFSHISAQMVAPPGRGGQFNPRGRL